MTTPMHSEQGVPQSITCRCGRRRGYLPSVKAEQVPIAPGEFVLLNGVLICGYCDYDHAHATVIPREWAIRDVP